MLSSTAAMAVPTGKVPCIVKQGAFRANIMGWKSKPVLHMANNYSNKCQIVTDVSTPVATPKPAACVCRTKPRTTCFQQQCYSNYCNDGCKRQWKKALKEQVTKTKHKEKAGKPCQHSLQC
jgi:hypothetical protein